MREVLIIRRDFSISLTLEYLRKKKVNYSAIIIRVEKLLPTTKVERMFSVEGKDFSLLKVNFVIFEMTEKFAHLSSPNHRLN